MQNDNKKYRILIAGDLIPTKNNYQLFSDGEVESLFGKDMCELFAKADFSIFNLEGALTNSNICQEKEGPVIKAPVDTINGIKNLGVTAVALANNHITDYLNQGYFDTVKALDSANIQYVGAGPNAADVKRFISFHLGEKRICIYNVSETFFNKPGVDTAGVHVYDEYLVCNEIKELKKSHDFIIVIYHGGAEYFQYPTPQTRIRFHRMADCGANFITAQHTHCIGCEEYYNGSYLLYGQGNFLFACQRGEIMKRGLLSEIVLLESGFSVINHLVLLKENVVRIDAEKDLSSFYERSNKINDADFIISQYKKQKSKEIKNKYLLSYKGRYPFMKILMHLCPKYKMHLEKTYSKQQLLRNLNVVQGERRCEDMYYVFQFLLDNYGK